MFLQQVYKGSYEEINFIDSHEKSGRVKYLTRINQMMQIYAFV